MAISVEAQSLFDAGLALHQQGDLAAAKRKYEQSLALEPHYFDAKHLLGVVAAQSRQFDRAVALLTDAVAINPGHAQAHNHLGIALAGLSRFHEAIEVYGRAIDLHSDYAEAFNNRSIAHNAIGEHQAAIADCERALQLKPINPEAYLNRAAAERALRRFDDALSSYDLLLRQQPALPQALLGRSYALVSLGRTEEAIDSLQQLIAAEPSHAEACNLLAHTLAAGKQFGPALAYYDQAIAQCPDFPYLRGTRLHTQTMICDWSDVASRWVEIASALEKGEAVIPPFATLALTDDPRRQLQAARVWANHNFPENRALGPIAPAMPREKIRVAYVSPDFRSHAVAFLMEGVFLAHDRDRFELTAFAWGSRAPDVVSKRLAANFDHFIDVRNMPDIDVAALARRLGIDIAVDLAGHTSEARQGIFSFRAAPIQCAYLGYPATSGSASMDYIIGDVTTITTQNAAFFSEKTVRLPHCFMAGGSNRALQDPPTTRSAQSLPDATMVYCCFNSSYKISRDMFDVWMRILRQVDHGVLWLPEGPAETLRNLRREAELRGISPGRLIFAPRLANHADHLSRLAAADLFLDTSPYNAHTTAIDALAAGVPVLTCPGEAMASRVAASMLNTLDLKSLIAPTISAYEEKAVNLGRDARELSLLKAALGRNRANSPLFSVDQLARSLERAFVAMYERARNGLAPDHLDVTL